MIIVKHLNADGDEVYSVRIPGNDATTQRIALVAMALIDHHLSMDVGHSITVEEVED